MWVGLQFELKVLRSISILGSNLTLNCFDGVYCRHTCWYKTFLNEMVLKERDGTFIDKAT